MTTLRTTTKVMERLHPEAGFDEAQLAAVAFLARYSGRTLDAWLWGGTHGDLWPIYDTIKKPAQAASDHAAIYADLTI